MTENNQVTEDKPNPSSERKPKPLKKSLLDYNVTSARPEDVSLSEEPRASFSWTSRKSESKEPEREMPCTSDCLCRLFNFYYLFFPLMNKDIYDMISVDS